MYFNYKQIQNKTKLEVAFGNSNIFWVPTCKFCDCAKCGSNVFQGYFDDAKESRVKQSFKQRFRNQVSSIKIQDSTKIKIKIQDSRFKNQEKTQSR